MSYDIYIGEAQILDWTSGTECDLCCNSMEVSAKGISLDEAPEFPGDTMTGKGNSRHPGYCQFGEFTDRVGLDKLFYDKEVGLLRKHPGAFRLLPQHLETIRDTLKRHIDKFGDLNPGWHYKNEEYYDEAWNALTKKEQNKRLAEGDRARLIWFEWWMDWALKNCKIPVVSNT